MWVNKRVDAPAICGRAERQCLDLDCLGEAEVKTPSQMAVSAGL